MAEKKKTEAKATTKKSTTKTAPKKVAEKKVVEVKEATKVEAMPVVKEVVTEDPMKKVMVCLYILIALVVINIVVTVNTKGTSSNNTTTQQGEEESGEYDVSMFEAITSDTFADKVSSETPVVVYIGRSTCGYCVQFLPALQKAQEEFGYKTLYLDITTITTTEQQEAILAYDNDEQFLSENFGSTPMVLIMQSGKIVDTWVGYSEYDTYASWLKENGFEAK